MQRKVSVHTPTIIIHNNDFTLAGVKGHRVLRSEHDVESFFTLQNTVILDIDVNTPPRIISIESKVRKYSSVIVRCCRKRMSLVA